MNNDSNEKNTFERGCTEEWYLDEVKFADCIVHSDNGEELNAVDKVTGIWWSTLSKLI